MPNILVYVNDKVYVAYLEMPQEAKKELRKKVQKMISKGVGLNGDN